ncbi:MAG TPA: AAA family ATPase [Kaistia sp.]|jgi:cellulose biosynthesis protein BcsQ|nr:AAA family ATPase [Kaistia sp.]
MRTIAFFNSRGGAGKTSLVYHLAWMFAERGLRVLTADLDPQANLTNMSLGEERLEALWLGRPRPTMYSAVEPLLVSGTSDVIDIEMQELTSRLALLPGDLALSKVEDELSQQWPHCLDRKLRAFRVVTAFDRVIRAHGASFGADMALIDVGPNLGAINRCALIASDHVVIPLAPDLFSIQGIENVGPALRDWREAWDDRRKRAPQAGFPLPAGRMEPIGYVVSRHAIFAGSATRADQHWIDRVPSAYAKHVVEEAPPEPGAEDRNCLARLKDYRWLMAMAQEARKPMFLLKPGNGAIGGHQGAVQDCYADFRRLANRIASRVGIQLPNP